MKCKRCRRILDETKEGLQACIICGLPYTAGVKAEVIEEEEKKEVEAESTDSGEIKEEIEE